MEADQRLQKSVGLRLYFPVDTVLLVSEPRPERSLLAIGMIMAIIRYSNVPVGPCDCVGLIDFQSPAICVLRHDIVHLPSRPRLGSSLVPNISSTLEHANSRWGVPVVRRSESWRPRRRSINAVYLECIFYN